MRTKRKYRVLRILGWIVLSFFTLILLLTLGFYLGRDRIMNRAVSYLNENQPGEVQMEKMNLIPFMNFPDVSLQLRNLSYYEKAIHPDSLYQEPILGLNEVYITLDVIDLIRKDIQVSETRIEKGFLRLEMYEDSISNLEKALGMRISKNGKAEESSGLPLLRVNLEKMELTDILLIMNDRTGNMHLMLQVNQLESSFSYLPEIIEASIEVNMNINNVKYLTYKDETKRNILFESKATLNPESKTIHVKPSRLEVSGLELETWGSYAYFDKPKVDFEFRAKNEGLELLNYIFRGILDLDELEQIGEGSINLSGDIRGFLGDTLPVVHITGSADELGFRIKSIQKDVREISFKVDASNGSRIDFSDGFLKIENFKAKFPEGDISANISAVNLASPELKVELQGEVDLLGMDEMIQTDLFSRLEGRVAIDGDMEGSLDRESGKFLNKRGYIHTRLEDVSFLLHGDSSTVDSVKHLNGQLDLEQNVLAGKNLGFEYNGNQMNVGFQIENILFYSMGFDKDVKAELSASADKLKVASLMQDTSLTNLLGDELRGLHFRAGAYITSEELDNFLKSKTLPELELTLDSFGIELPVYADISNMNASLSISADTLLFHYLNGVVGESEFSFSGHLAHYGILTGQDSAEMVSLEFDISSDLMLAEDFFTLNNEFLLPEAYQSEYLEDFHLDGTVDLPAEGLLNDSLSVDFALNIRDLAWNFRYYPLSFENFLMQVNREGEQLHIENFQGRVGESNLKMQARLENFRDSLVENLKGELVLESDLLDFNKLLNYQVPAEIAEDDSVTMAAKEPPRLDQISYPQFSFTVDIEELRYGDFNFYDLNGRLRSSNEKIFHLDQLSLSGRSGGSMAFHGQFNVANPYMYTFSAEMDMQEMNIDDLDIEMQTGDTLYTLKENFDGRVSADGIAEIFITPDLEVDMAATTAIFNVRIDDGALINFTPLQAAAKFLDNRDLNYVKFATLQNSFPLTLMDSKIIVPLMNVESTVGQMLIEGEQGLDKSFLYLLRIPPNLAREAARSVLTDAKDKEEEDQIQEMRRGNFYNMTVWSDGINSDFKLGDKRDKFQE
ncbi:MAG: hypothetical protein ABFS28_03100 [Bacteroidota bacterium]